MKAALKAKQLITLSEMFSELAAFYSTNVSRPFEFIIGMNPSPVTQNPKTRQWES